MLKIGITGGIGSGKTIVCKLFTMLGVPVFYADLEAKKLYADPTVLKQVIDLLGVEVLDDSKRPDFKKIGQIIFNDAEKLKALNAILHPAVFSRFHTWCAEHKSSPYILKEAAILFESGANIGLDKVIAVSAPEEIRIQRVMDRDGSSKEDVLRRIKNQMSDEERNSKADFIIDNNDGALLLPQVMELHKTFSTKS